MQCHARAAPQGEDAMSHWRWRGVALGCLGALIGFAGSGVKAQEPAYMNPHLSPEQRAADLVQRMTLEEKASQLVNQARAIPRLHVPSYDWWSEVLHGVAVNGTTEFPEPIGLGATFDPTLVHAMGVDISTEARVKHEQAMRANGGHSNIFQGLDFWAPNLNIFRDPRWGRGQETYGEDPFLTGRMGVAFVTGMQGDDPRYYRVIATPKHFDVHSGPEPTRHKANVDVSKHDEVDTYLPAFRAAVVEGKADSVMCAYNSINGEPACANQFLLQDQLRGKWGFKGYVVSDCGAVIDIFSGHHFKPTQAQASAISLQRGMDNECADFFAKVKDDHDYKPYVDAVKQGYLKESEIDTAVERLFVARIKLGMFDPASMDPYSKIPESELNSPAHKALALRAADESMVLLKNDGTLPLKDKNIRIAVVGPLADQTTFLLGNYTGVPDHMQSILDGMKEQFANDQIDYVQGTQFLSSNAQPVPSSALSTNGKPGVTVDIDKAPPMDLSARNMKPTVLSTTHAAYIDAAKVDIPDDITVPVALHWDATLKVQETGDYNLGMTANGFFRLQVDGQDVTSNFGYRRSGTRLGRIHLEKGKAYTLSVDYVQGENTQPMARLMWSKVDMTPQPDAIATAKKDDVIVAVVGITSRLEGEEMKVNEPGFLGGDRTSIDLPKPEEDLLEALSATGKPLVVVLVNGSALAVNWAKEHANAILEAWYPGEKGGLAVAQTLSGWNNPAGRLPVTFYTGVDQLPQFEDYAMKNRTYRYFTGTPLYPFGYGLSYTTYSYSDLKVPTAPVRAGDPVLVKVAVTNTGKRDGDEVAQLYLSFPDVPGAPLKALRSFRRVHLTAGQTKQVEFALEGRDMSMVSADGEPEIPAGSYKITVGGGQPGTGAQTLDATVTVEGSKTLPE